MIGPAVKHVVATEQPVINVGDGWGVSVGAGWGVSAGASPKISFLREASSLSDGAEPANAAVLKASSEQRNRAVFFISESPQEDLALKINEVIALAIAGKLTQDIRATATWRVSAPNTGLQADRPIDVGRLAAGGRAAQADL